MKRLTPACGPLALMIALTACAPAPPPVTAPEPTLAREIRSTPKPAAGVCWARLTEPRAERWFRTPCPKEMTQDLIATLQRALKVRGAYHGPVSGVMDTRTSAAVRAWQTPRGLNSAILSWRAAQELGLLPWPRNLEPT
ncbi:peptidoglycan-binding domain-containing protein [Phaeovulum sp.]|uniref:peptidoglycan-binding domain-containing protein n=1 Tax=Phaeovulum sp. TaxID=2934796 RepID=UPI0039E22ED8